jgi:hypothetical protein
MQHDDLDLGAGVAGRHRLAVGPQPQDGVALGRVELGDDEGLHQAGR